MLDNDDDDEDEEDEAVAPAVHLPSPLSACLALCRRKVSLTHSVGTGAKMVLC